MHNNKGNGLKHITILLAGICVGALAMWGLCSFRNSETLQGDDKSTQERLSGSDRKGALDSLETNASQEDSVTELQKVDFPFGYGREEWRLVLCRYVVTVAKVPVKTGYLFRMYDENGTLLQEFACDYEAEELLFRFDALCSNRGDLEVFSADAQQTGSDGLLFAWDDETKRFRQEPISIPWYETNDSYFQAYLVRSREDNVERESIYRLNPRNLEPVEIRRWLLSGNPEEGEKGHLEILNCLAKVSLYDGEVEWNELGDLVNNKYYQGLFWRELEWLYDREQARDRELTVLDVFWDGNYEDFGKRIYDSRESFLADYGFADQTPFYEYADVNKEFALELFFDRKKEMGCGLYYNYSYNCELEKIVDSYGFVFRHVETGEWVPEDMFSTRSVFGDDARDLLLPKYRETYQYTDDGKLSAFEARGIIPDLGDGSIEDVILSMDYYYRDDGTLALKKYHHHSLVFGTAEQSERSWYDEFERMIYRYSYITHGSLEYFYIYEDDRECPAYVLALDNYTDSVWPMMTAYK